MIKSITFSNFRNLNGKYYFNKQLSVVIGKNNSGKTNLLEGIRLAFSSITNDYFKISLSDFYNSDDHNNIEINVELTENSIPTLNFLNSEGKTECGFKVIVKRTQSGRYVKECFLLNGSNVDMESLREDLELPNLYFIPLIRIEDIYSAGLTTGISKFIDSEEKYKELKEDSKNAIIDEISEKRNKFKELCKMFNQDLDIELTDPKFMNEKLYIVDGSKEHNYNIGSGYKSIANIMLNTLDEKFNIILIDEIENHLHPSLIRTLVRELRNVKNTIIIATTHSPVVINALDIDEIVDINCKRIDELSEDSIKKLNVFLHPGRNELMLAENVIMVEGYSEEILLKAYLKTINHNWTIVNVAGVMFEPYIELASLLNKKIVVVSDNDKSTTDGNKPSSRFSNLKELCTSKSIKLIEVDNTVESDLYENHFLDNCLDLLKPHEKYPNIYIAKDKKKTEIALKLIENETNLDNWHVLKEIKNELKGC